MTKPVTRKMAVDCLLWRFILFGQAISTQGPTVTGLPCSVCGEPLLPGQQIQFDHTHADALGGGNTYMDIRPIHYDPCHKEKTKSDVQALAKIDRILGLTKNGPKRKIPSRPFPKKP